MTRRADKEKPPEDIHLPTTELLALLEFASGGQALDVEAVSGELGDGDSLEEGRQGLLERQLLVEVDGRLELSPECAPIVAAVASAQATIMLERASEVEADWRLYHVAPEYSVEQSLAGEEHRLLRFPTAELADRLLDAAGMGAALTVSDCEPVSVRTSALLAELDRAQSGPPAGGAASSLPDEVARALSDVSAGIKLQCTRWEEGMMRGCDLTLLESPSTGLSLVEPLESRDSDPQPADDEPVEIRPIAAAEVLKLLLDELPEGVYSPAT